MMKFLIELFLHIFDGVMNVITRSRWSRWQGSKVPNVKIKPGWKS